jgi:hypothetical protein
MTLGPTAASGLHLVRTMQSLFLEPSAFSKRNCSLLVRNGGSPAERFYAHIWCHRPLFGSTRTGKSAFKEFHNFDEYNTGNYVFNGSRFQL